MADAGCLLVTAPLKRKCEAIVVIPVHNEEKWILRCLSAFDDQQGVTPNQFELIFLLNNCTDSSQTLVRKFAGDHSHITIHVVNLQLQPDQANIGTVRRLLMEEACRRFARSNKWRGAILTTDGDTTVDKHWIAHNLAELRLGADAVGGRIALDSQEMRYLAPSVRRHYWWDLVYGLLRARLESELDPVPWDPWPRHHQNFCGSLAITAAVYSQTGGIPNVKNLEDLALCASILQAGGKIRHSPLVHVRTSARLEGRVGVGLSSHLRGFEDNEIPMVETVALTAEKFRASHDLRRNGVRQDQKEAVYKCIDEAWNGPRQMPIDEAVEELRGLICPLRASTKRHSRL